MTHLVLPKTLLQHSILPVSVNLVQVQMCSCGAQLGGSALQTRIYADDDGVRKEEIAALRGENMYRYGRLSPIRCSRLSKPISSTEATRCNPRHCLCLVRMESL